VIAFAPLLAALAATAAAEAPAPAETPNFSWISGYWISCAGGREVTETWNDSRAGVLMGSSITSRDDKVFFEHMRIAPASDGAGVSFYAMPGGAASTEFRLKEFDGQRAVFENLENGFPQRVIYERRGKTLNARIEGAAAGAESALEWKYAFAKFNARCR
jgi:hypothetical protein